MTREELGIELLNAKPQQPVIIEIFGAEYPIQRFTEREGKIILEVRP